MVFKERIPKSEIHLRLAKLQQQGYQKVKDFHARYKYTVVLERQRNNRTEVITCTMTNNGWCIWS